MAKKKKFSAMQAEKAAKRKAHFANGGTLAMWRGASQNFVDRKKKANKNACRGRVVA